MRNPFNILWFLVAFLLTFYAGLAKAGYLYNDICYPTAADALTGFQSSFPKEDAGRVYYLTASSVNATGLISATIASKSVTAVAVTAGVLNTYQLSACTGAALGSNQQLLTEMWGQNASMVAMASAAQVADTQESLLLASMVANTGTIAANTSKFPLDKIITIVACCLMFGIGYLGGRTA
ncbi:MAG: hypothetical protein WCI39_07020 [Gallionellaceae bacterium]